MSLAIRLNAIVLQTKKASGLFKSEFKRKDIRQTASKLNNPTTLDKKHQTKQPHTKSIRQNSLQAKDIEQNDFTQNSHTPNRFRETVYNTHKPKYFTNIVSKALGRKQHK